MRRLLDLVPGCHGLVPWRFTLVVYKAERTFFSASCPGCPALAVGSLTLVV
jgi:hypothetical protein